MSAGMLGADPQVLRDLAAKFDDAAQQLMGCRGSIQVWVDTRDIWRGLDNHQFTNMWDTTGAVSVMGAATAFQRCADVLRRNADAQDVASAADGSIVAGSGLFGGGGGFGVDGAGIGSQAPAFGPGFWGEFLDVSDSLLDHEVAPGWTIGDLTGLLGSLGLKGGAGTALGIALEAPELLSVLTDPDVPLGEKIGTAGKFAVDYASGGLMTLGVHTKNPALLLGGAAIMTWGTVFDEARHMDLSADGLNTFGEAILNDPWGSAGAAATAVGGTVWDWGKQISGAVVGGVLGP